MIALFLQSCVRYAQLIRWSLWPAKGSSARRSFRRAALMVPVLIGLGVVQAAHWIGFLLDEVFFRGYRRVPIDRPVFILGVPRSGTTLLHRTLARDDQFTTMQTWECFFALSVTARVFWRFIGRVDAKLNRPLGRLLDRSVRALTGSLDDVHAVSLEDAEEDYFALVPIWACFILCIPFPDAPWLKTMRYFDRDMLSVDRERLLDYYEMCIRRHLYVHRGQTYLSKNAAFASMAGSLRERFPDARFVVCMRDPAQAAPSQLSSLMGGHELFDNDPSHPRFRDELLDILRFDYQHLRDSFAVDDAAAFVGMAQLQESLGASVRDLYREFELVLDEDFAGSLASDSRDSSTYRSAHRYELGEFGHDGESVREYFADAYESYDFSTGRPIRHRDSQ